MTLLLELALFVIGATFGLLWVTVILLRLFYALPRSVYGIARGQLRTSAVLRYLITITIWTVVFVCVTLVLTLVAPTASRYLYNNAAFSFGQALGVIGALVRLLTESGRQDLREDFTAATAKHRR